MRDTRTQSTNMEDMCPATRNICYCTCCRGGAEVADSFGVSTATYPQFLTPLQTGSGCLSIRYTREWPTTSDPPERGLWVGPAGKVAAFCTSRLNKVLWCRCARGMCVSNRNMWSASHFNCMRLRFPCQLKCGFLVVLQVVTTCKTTT